MMINSKLPENIEGMIGAAVSHYWDTRLSQQQKQQKSGKVDYDLRGAVTGGAQMDGFIELFTCLSPQQILTRLSSKEKDRLNYQVISGQQRSGTFLS